MTSSAMHRRPPERRPPGPRPDYPGQFIVRLARDMRGLFHQMSQLGDVTQITLAWHRVVVLNHPADIQRVLVTEQKNFVKGRALGRTKALLGEGLLTSEGDLHLRQRRLAQPAFHRDRIASYAHAMSSYADRMQRGWVDGSTIDVHAAMMHLTLQIAGKTLFDEDVDENAGVVSEAINLSLRMFNYTVVPFGTVVERLPIPWVRRWHRARERMDAYIVRLIAERRRDGVDRGDLLSMLIDMDDAQLRDEVVTILMAGHETTAVALSWTFYLLSQYPGVERALHAELDRVLGGRVPTVDDLPKLTYTRAVFAESMRLYPPAWVIERRAVEPFRAGGYRIPADTLVLVSQYNVHRDRRWWPEPERFDPDRWSRDDAAARPKFAYFPFGGGTRMCIGEQFAWMEGTLVLATVAQRWRLAHDPTHRVAMEPLVTLRPKYGMRMQLTPR
jgi:cytochrome P450